jgi:hypothetical protein
MTTTFGILIVAIVVLTLLGRLLHGFIAEWRRPGGAR